jgi:hypothetical protein
LPFACGDDDIPLLKPIRSAILATKPPNATKLRCPERKESDVDPITAAILAALPTLASDTVKSGVKDAYDGLKAVIRRKWGEAAPISKAISALEGDPNSRAQAAVLEEKVGAVKATEDAEVLQALHTLLEQMKANGIGGEAVASIHLNISGGTQTGIIGAQTVSTGTITFGKT